MHIMIDIETMGVCGDAAITQIGCVAFDPVTGETAGGRSLHVDLQSSLDEGLKVDASTIRWWMQQSDASRHALTLRGMSLSAALEQVTGYFNQHEPSRVWVQGPHFDIAILQQAFWLCNMSIPWSFRHVRDARTVISLSGVPKSPLRGEELEHDALDDCHRQIRGLFHAARRMNISLDEERN